MKQTKRWLAVLLAAVLLMGALPGAALAAAEEEDPWAGAAEVSDFAAFKAALGNSGVEKIKITGEVTVDEGTLASPLAANKPILISQEGSLKLADGAAMTSNVPMGQFDYEDQDQDMSMWERIAGDMAAFLLWGAEDGGTHRLLCGAQDDAALSEVLASKEHGYLFQAVFGTSVTLRDPVTAWIFLVMNEHNLTIAEGGSLKAEGYLEVQGNLSVAEGGLLTLGEDGDGAWIEGDVEFLGPEGPGRDVLDRLGYDRENHTLNYTHLAVCWTNEDGSKDYDWALEMTPLDEQEVTFAMQYYGDAPGGWQYKPVRPTIPQGLCYQEREHDQKMVLTTAGKTWNQTYEITYTENGHTYTLPVYVCLPRIGCFKAPQYKEANYINTWNYSLFSSNTFYLCVDPETDLMTDDTYTLSHDLIYNGDERGRALTSWEWVRDGVWKITVTGGDFYANFQIPVTYPTEEGEETDVAYANGVWIDNNAQPLFYANALLSGASPYPEDPESPDREYQDSYRSLLHDTLSLRAGASKDVVLYQLVYNGEIGKWTLECVPFDWAEGRNGVTLSEVPGKAFFTRVTAGSGAASAQIARQHGQQTGPNEYAPIPGSTRGTPLTVTVTSGIQQGGGSNSSGGSDRDGSHSISTPSRVVGGEVKLQTKNAKKGDQVTVTVTAKEGYVLKGLSVTDTKGASVAVTDRGNGTFTFTMPDSRVKVTPDFQRISNTQPSPASGFADVPSGAYYHDAVQWAVSNGITGGVTGTSFAPNASCTRAQTATFLWRAAGSPAPTGRNTPFRDVSSSAYYYEAVLWAVEQGITSGVSADTFQPNATVTRGQAATFLHRAAGSPAAAGSSSFTDVPSGAYYAGAIQWALERGITGDTTASTFSPNANCTRAQIVTFLFRSQS